MLRPVLHNDTTGITIASTHMTPFRSNLYTQVWSEKNKRSSAEVPFSSSIRNVSTYAAIDRLYIRLRPHKHPKYFLEICLKPDLSKQYGMKPLKKYSFKISYEAYKELMDNRTFVPIKLVKRNIFLKPFMEPYRVKIDSSKMTGLTT